MAFPLLELQNPIPMFFGLQAIGNVSVNELGEAVYVHLS